MAENKKSFILYSDQRDIFDELSNEDAGELIKHIFKYVNDENPITDNSHVKLAFISIRNQLKRDLKRWESTRAGRSLAGKASAEAKRKKKQSSTKSTSVKSVQQNSTKSTVNVNDTVNVTVNDIQTKIEFASFYNLYAHKVGAKKAKAKWDKLPLKTQKLIMDYLPKYVLATSTDGTYPTRRHPTTFLNNDTWLDAIPEKPDRPADKNTVSTPYEHHG
jgi:hypothetical protein